jgi:hypothetical protein
MRRTWDEVGRDEEQGDGAESDLPVAERREVSTWLTATARRVMSDD